MPEILVVDDGAVDRQLAGRIIGQMPDARVTYAENGNEAIEQMQRLLPDLVLTDMQMPEMDGLELVTRIRMVHPGVPVVLMTSKGSEAIAVEALERGAASYVPKPQLNESLCGIVSELLATARADRSYSKLMACQDRIEFSYTLHNDVELFAALVDLVQQMVDVMELTDHTGKLRVGLAIHEALLNAMYRGNLEISTEEMPQVNGRTLESKSDLLQQRQSQAPYCDRKIYVDVCIDRQEAKIVVRDEGPGYDAQTLLQASDHSALVAHDGKRGLVLMRAFLDSVQCNEAGNEVTMIKRREESRS